MANASVGTAWIQIKPTLKGISADIKKSMGDGSLQASTEFSKKFQSSFLASAKLTFAQAFGDFKQRSQQAWASFADHAKVGLAAATAGIILSLKSFVGAASELQGLRASFESLTGSAKRTDVVMRSLAEFGKNTAFTNDEINQSARLFLGANIEAKNLLGVMEDVGDLAGATGANLESIALPISQAFAAGKLQTQDYNQIMGNGAGVLKQYIIEALGAGHSVKTFSDDLSNGAVTAEVLRKSLDLASQKGSAAFEGALKQSRTFDGRMSNLQETITNVGLAILGVDSQTGKVDPSGLFYKLSESVEEATGWLEKNKSEIISTVNNFIELSKNTIKWISDNRELIKNVLIAFVAFKSLQIATGGVIAGMQTLSLYGKIAKGSLHLMIGTAQVLFKRFRGVEEVTKKSKKAAEGIDTMSKAAKRAPKKFAFGDRIGDFFKNIGKTLSGAVNAVMAPLKAVAQGGVDIIKIVLKGAGEGIAGFFRALSNPQILIGVVVFAAAAGAVALSILMIGSAVGAVTPGLGDFLNIVLVPLGTFLLGVFLAALVGVTNALIDLTTKAVIPLVGAVSGGLTQALNAIGGVITRSGNAIARVVNSISGGVSRVINSTANLISSVGGQDWYGTGYGITRNFSAGLIDGLIDLLQDSLNNVINHVISVPAIGDALKAVGVNANPVNLRGFKLGRRAMGGPVFGPGSDTSDSIPMALSNGEYVIKASTARKIGYGNLDRLNQTGAMGGTVNVGGIKIIGYDKDPRELAHEISRIISLEQKRVMA